MKEATVSEINTEAPKKECSSRLLLSGKRDMVKETYVIVIVTLQFIVNSLCD